MLVTIALYYHTLSTSFAHTLVYTPLKRVALRSNFCTPLTRSNVCTHHSPPRPRVLLFIIYVSDVPRPALCGSPSFVKGEDVYARVIARGVPMAVQGVAQRAQAVGPTP